MCVYNKQQQAPYAMEFYALIITTININTPGLRYKIPVFSDPDPGKS